MTDLTLFDPAARHTDPETSHIAAASITGTAARALEREILDAFRIRGRMCDEELTLGPLIHRYAPTVITARSRLTRSGRLVDTGDRRLSSRRRPQIVWVVA